MPLVSTTNAQHRHITYTLFLYAGAAKKPIVAGEMVQWLGALALAEDLGSILSTHMAQPSITPVLDNALFRP